VLARAALANPETGVSDETNGEHIRALDEAERALLAEPARSSGAVWRKFEVLESVLATDLVDNRSIVALASIRTDLMTHGLGDGWA
jgi:hypothetical protein